MFAKEMNHICPLSLPSKSYDYPLVLPLIFLASLFFLIPQNAVAEPQYLMVNCLTTFNYTAFSPFQNNLNRLLDRKLFNEGAISGFYNTSDGENPDKVYGLFLCRGDVALQDCQDCIDAATQEIIQDCPGNKEAFIWYDECLVRYANRSFFSTMESTPAFAMWNAQNVTQPHKFSDTLANMFQNLTTVAISNPSMHLYATTEVNISSTPMSLYGLVQCTPDLSPFDCKTCLYEAVALILSYSMENKMGGRIFQPSCNIRFELYSFHGDPRVDARAPPPSSLVNSTDGDPKEWKAIWAAICVGISGVLFSGICVYIIWRRNKSKQEDKENSQEVQLLGLGGERIQDKYLNDHFHPEKSQSQEFPSIPLDIVEAATKHFSDENKLGQGGFGPVYKGTLSDGKEIAVKRLSRTSGQGLVEFQNEITLIARLQHRNLVRLLGCCLEGNETLLIYEYMPNKSLDVFLFDSSIGEQLDWKRRFSIINGIARGILYLHEDSRLRIIHRDLKASNVLLDQEMNPKISDFGMARIVGGNQIEGNTNRVVGTYGYMAPEYAMEGLFSIKSDVFSFGVLLLEIISGKKNNGFYLSENGHSLLTFAWKLWCEGEGLEVIDPLLVQSCVGAEVLKCIHIGLLCVQEDPADRPTMSSVVVMLGSETITLNQPKEPAFSVGRVIARKPADPWPNSSTCSVNEVTCTNVSAR